MWEAFGIALELELRKIRNKKIREKTTTTTTTTTTTKKKKTDALKLHAPK